MIKKATSKRERKYGKKNEEGLKVSKPSKKEKKVKLMVDGFSIMEFDNRALADKYIADRIEAAEAKRQRPPNFTFF